MTEYIHTSAIEESVDKVYIIYLGRVEVGQRKTGVALSASNPPSGPWLKSGVIIPIPNGRGGMTSLGRQSRVDGNGCVYLHLSTGVLAVWLA